MTETKEESLAIIREHLVNVQDEMVTKLNEQLNYLPALKQLVRGLPEGDPARVANDLGVGHVALGIAYLTRSMGYAGDDDKGRGRTDELIAMLEGKLEELKKHA